MSDCSRLQSWEFNNGSVDFDIVSKKWIARVVMESRK